MNTHDRGSKLWNEVQTNLADLEFPIREGLFVEGELASIEAIASRRKGRDDYDLEVTITPHALRDDLDPDVEAGAREGFEDALNDIRPGIRAAAAQELARLDSPRISGHELQNGTLLLRRKVGDSWTILLPPGKTDRRGRARFFRIPDESTYSVGVHSVGLRLSDSTSVEWPDEAGVEGSVATEEWANEAAAEAWGPVEGGLARLRELRSVAYTLPDRRLTAVLEELPRGGAAIAIRSQATELVGAGVRFRIGNETGEVRLAADPSGAAIGSVDLGRPYREVEAQIPSFGVVATRPDCNQ